MPLVPLSKITSNPWRDLKLYPIEPDQVAKLVESIEQHGFFGGVKARPTPGNGGSFQLACGHHRIEAAKQARLKEVDIAIGMMDDDEMIRLMATENATQAGGKAAAVMNDLGAVTRRLAYVLLSEPDMAPIGAKYPQLAEIFQDSHGYYTAQGHLKAGEGIGWRIVMRYLGGGDDKRCPRSKREINEGIDALKQSGTYAKIVREVELEIKREVAEAQERAAKAEREARRAEREAEQARGQAEHKRRQAQAEKADADAKLARKRHERLQTLETELKATASRSEAKNPRILDDRAANVFENDAQFTAFREAITTDAAKRFIPISQQLPLAKQMMDQMGKQDKGDRKRVGAPFIKSYVASYVSEAVAAQRQINEDEKQRLADVQQQGILETEITTMMSGLRAAIQSGSRIKVLVGKHPFLAKHPHIGAIEVKIDAAIQTLRDLKKELF